MIEQFNVGPRSVRNLPEGGSLRPQMLVQSLQTCLEPGYPLAKRPQRTPDLDDHTIQFAGEVVASAIQRAAERH